ncbi:MAG: prolipoprotein diacylglyceryl transferase [Proteobacteria bacterium]|nr:prolipoprotein diacylglyceryl transferase [Pseudomonadota bacterium]
MWQYPDLDPIAISVGPISIHWYAISYLVGIGLVWLTLRYRIRRDGLPWTDDDIADIVFYAVLGVLLGGRLGYMLFYGLDLVLAEPTRLFRIWEGGMSFHGGLLGVLLSVMFYARKKGVSFFDVTDLIAPSIPLALGCGRIGNFINTELPGRVTDVPWAVIFPGDIVARHPSSLYQAVLEGAVLFAFLWIYVLKPRPLMAASGLFLIGYGVLRIVSEFFREPDVQIGYVLADWVTTGQLLSLPMVLLGCCLMTYAYLKSGKLKSR